MLSSVSNRVASVLGAAVISLPLITGSASAQAVNDDQVKLCVKHIAEMERTVARQTSGEERKRIILMLGEAKRACIKGQIGVAYQDASKGLQLAKRAANR